MSGFIFLKMKIPDIGDTGIMENDSLILCVVLFLEKIFCIIKKLSSEVKFPEIFAE